MKTPESWALEITMAAGVSFSNRQFNKIVEIVRTAESPEKKARELMLVGKRALTKMVK